MQEEVEPPGLIECRNGEECKRPINERRKPPDVSDDGVEEHVEEAVKGKYRCECSGVLHLGKFEPHGRPEKQEKPYDRKVRDVGMVVVLPLIYQMEVQHVEIRCKGTDNPGPQERLSMPSQRCKAREQ